MSSNNWIIIIVAVLVVGFLVWLVARQIHENYLASDPMLHELRRSVSPLFAKDKKYVGILEPINGRNVMDEIGLYRGNKSYTINKEKVFLCLKNDKNEYYNKQVLLHIILHELSHVINDEIGHGEKFHDIFDALLAEAVKCGIYDPNVDIPLDYCANGDAEVEEDIV
jgi:hypothetical protein